MKKPLLLLVILFLAGCTAMPAAALNAIPRGHNARKTLAADDLSSPTPTRTYAPRPTHFPRPTATPTSTATPDPGTPTPATALPTPYHPTLALGGTPLPTAIAAPGIQNYHALSFVAQWGWGIINGAAFTPDGRSFIVGSPYGYAIYSTNSPRSAPRWVPFATPVYYSDLYFSSDGAYLLLESRNNVLKNQVRAFPSGQMAQPPPGLTWLKTTNWAEKNLQSPDGRLELMSSRAFDENYEDELDFELSVREIFSPSSGEQLFALPDKTFYTYYEDYNEPKGCDQLYSSPCGFSTTPKANHPYWAGFAPTSDSLAIIYRPRYLEETNLFSTLRVYHMADGRLLNTIGGKGNPVATFAYAPDGQTLVIGFVNGLVSLWKVGAKDPFFSAQHFNGPILAVEYSPGGAYLFVQRANSVEVRTTSEGALRSRFDAAAFALSPTENILALGRADGTLRLVNFSTGQNIFRIPAHTKKIYALAFSPDGKTIISSGEDCGIRNWAADSGKFLHNFAENIANPYTDPSTETRIFIKFLRYIPGENQLIGWARLSGLVSWNATSGATQYQVVSDEIEFYNSEATPDQLSPHFPEFFRLDSENRIFYLNQVSYDLKTGQMQSLYRPPAGVPAGCYTAGPASQDGKIRFTLGYDQHVGRICVLDADNYRLLRLIELQPAELNEKYPLNWLYLSPRGDHLLVTTTAGAIYVLQVKQP